MSQTTETAIALHTEQIQADRKERQDFRENLTLTMDAIRKQVEKTNGRVTRLEQWRMFLLGGFAALSLPYASNIVRLFSH